MKNRYRSVLSTAAIAGVLFTSIASTDEEPAAKVEEPTGADSDSSADTASTETSEVEATAFLVGDLVSLGDWQLKVHEVIDPFESTNEFFEPDEGNRWVAVDVEVTNTSSEPTSVSSLMCFELMDGDNRAYDVTITGESTSSMDGDVAPGGSRRGTVEFEVPNGADELALNFNCELFSSTTATIEL